MQPTSTASPLDAIIARFVKLEPGEVPVLLASFFYYFTILTGYYIVRPVRDAMGTMVDRAELQNVFVIVFVRNVVVVIIFVIVDNFCANFLVAIFVVFVVFVISVVFCIAFGSENHS